MPRAIRSRACLSAAGVHAVDPVATHMAEPVSHRPDAARLLMRWRHRWQRAARATFPPGWELCPLGAPLARPRQSARILAGAERPATGGAVRRGCPASRRIRSWRSVTRPRQGAAWSRSGSDTRWASGRSRSVARACAAERSTTSAMHEGRRARSADRRWSHCSGTPGRRTRRTVSRRGAASYGRGPKLGGPAKPGSTA